MDLNKHSIEFVQSESHQSWDTVKLFNTIFNDF